VGLLLHKALEHWPDVLLVYSDPSNYQREPTSGGPDDRPSYWPLSRGMVDTLACLLT